ncbi:unnamed protein product, partial [Mesorhabditis spiculigera]
MGPGQTKHPGLVAVFGVFSNAFLLRIFIARKPSNDSPSKLYPALLAVLDILLCIAYLLLFVVDVQMIYLQDVALFTAYHSYIIWVLSFSRMNQLAIPCLLILATAERLAWLTPKMRRSRSAGRRQIAVAVGVVTLCVLIRIPALYLLDVDTFPGCSEPMRRLAVAPTILASDPWWFFYDTYFIVIIQTVIPFVVLIVLNIIIVRRLGRKEKLLVAGDTVEDTVEQKQLERRRSSGGSRVIATFRLYKTSSSVRSAVYAMVAIVCTYLVSNGLHIFLLLLEKTHASVLYVDGDEYQASGVYTALSDSVSIAYMLSSAVRLFIYAACNREVRQQLIYFGTRLGAGEKETPAGWMSVEGQLRRSVNATLLHNLLHRDVRFRETCLRSMEERRLCRPLEIHQSVRPPFTRQTAPTVMALEGGEANFLLCGGANGEVSLRNLGLDPADPMAWMSMPHKLCHRNFVNDCQFYTNDIRLFVTGAQDGVVKLWDLNEVRVLDEWRFDTAPLQLHWHEWSTKGGNPLIAVATKGSQIRLIDTRAGIAQELSSRHQSVVSIRWCPTRRHLLLAGTQDGALLAFDARSGRGALATLQPFQKTCGVVALRFSQSGWVAVPYREKILWATVPPEGDDGDVDVRELAGHFQSVNDVLYRNHSQQLLSAGGDQQLLVWGALGQKLGSTARRGIEETARADAWSDED